MDAELTIDVLRAEVAALKAGPQPDTVFVHPKAYATIERYAAQWDAIRALHHWHDFEAGRCDCGANEVTATAKKQRRERFHRQRMARKRRRGWA